MNEVLNVTLVEETFHSVDLAVTEFTAGSTANFSVTAGLPLREVLQLGALGVQSSKLARQPMHEILERLSCC